MRRLILTLTLCGAFFAGEVAASVEHKVYIERRGFFPQTVHVAPGDTIRFINKAPRRARLYSEDAYDNLTGYDDDDPCATSSSSGSPYFSGSKDGWNTGWIEVNDDYVLAVTSCMETTITSPEVQNYSYNANNYRGYVSFDPPDLGQ